MRYSWRYYFILFIFAGLFFALMWRAFQLTALQRDFLLAEGEKRSTRVQATPAHRGMITDRYGNPLAISTPVTSIWINPEKMQEVNSEQWQTLANTINIPLVKLKKFVRAHQSKHFVYLKRRIPPQQAEKIMALSLPGVQSQKEYRRFYPKGEIAAQWVGLTNVDDQGMEGMELAYNAYLAGSPEKYLVMKDRQGAVVKKLRQLKAGQQGQVLTLSMDHRMQYIAYSALYEAVTKAKAKAGSIVVLKAKTGEVLAMADVPSYNPNNRHDYSPERSRNRAVTDTFEPGSTIKPFSALEALESGKYTMDTIVDTLDGQLNVDGYIIREHGQKYGRIPLAEVIKKSSNVGIARVAMSLPPDDLLSTLRRVGFGTSTLSGFPGEVGGRLVAPSVWKDANIAALSFGYGIATTTLQLAQAYNVLANHGAKLPIHLLAQKGEPQIPEAVFDAKHVDALLESLHQVVSSTGTGSFAQVPGYEVAGKTGTAYIAGAKGYDENARHYMASFVGMLPYPDPELVIAVVIRDPVKGHYGGQIAGPVFAKVASSVMRFVEESS